MVEEGVEAEHIALCRLRSIGEDVQCPHAEGGVDANVKI